MRKNWDNILYLNTLWDFKMHNALWPLTSLSGAERFYDQKSENFHQIVEPVLYVRGSDDNLNPNLANNDTLLLIEWWLCLKKWNLNHQVVSRNPIYEFTCTSTACTSGWFDTAVRTSKSESELPLQGCEFEPFATRRITY